MIAMALLLALQADSATICLEDARTQAPVSGAQVATVRADGTLGLPRIAASACLRVPHATVVIRRVGYRARSLSPAAGDAAQIVRLEPLVGRDSEGATLLETRVVVASRTPTLALGRVSERVEVADARATGVATAVGLLNALPFTSLRSARGETGLSLRGARREQVVITLDGLPLNDPATGIADVSDLPLVALGSATVALGADPLGTGPGASGGVVALESAPRRELAMRAGAFGARAIEGSWRAVGGGALWQASASHRRADNDFAFVNDAGGTGTPGRERRINNDEARSSMSVGVTGARVHVMLLGSSGERGMVGAMNVHTYDADRARTDRVLLRARATAGRFQVETGARAFALAYRDPARSELDSHAHAEAADAEVKTQVGAMALRLGGGADAVRATGGIAQARGRVFSVAAWSRRSRRGGLDAGARVDAIGAFGALPSFSLGGERTLTLDVSRASTVTLGARVAQSVRVPTLYDLYFSSPQRLFVRTLRPERVLVDGELQARATTRTGLGMLAMQGSVVARDTRDAIIWFPGNFGWSPANVGMERLRGAEARARLLPRWGELSAWMTHYDAMLASGGLRIPTPYVARTAGGALLQARHRATTASLSVRATGRRPYTAGPRDPAFELPAVTLGDIAIAHRLPLRASELLVTLSLDNATDVSWQSVRGFPSPGRSWAISTTLRHLP